MKDKFTEHYQYSDKELRDIWGDAIFVFDTNTLLNMYRYNRDTFDEYVRVLKSLATKKRLFLPYHVGEEFFQNRIKVIQDYKKSYDELLKLADTFRSQVVSKYRHHPFIDIKDLGDQIEASIRPSVDMIKEKSDEHPDWIKNDPVLDQLSNIFDNCVGDAYTKDELTKIYTEGEVRYEDKIPPGFKDRDKGGVRMYGDLVVWRQIIDFAKVKKKPIIFVTGDEKEDWWLLNEGERLMPLPALKKEIKDEAEVDFHAYTADRFLETYNQRYKSDAVKEKAIEEVRRLREIQELTQPNIDIDQFNRRFTYKNSHEEEYELFVAVMSRFIESMDHISELLNDSSRLEDIQRKVSLIRTIIRKVRINGKVNRFYVNRLIAMLESIEKLLYDEVLESEDEILTKRLESYVKELSVMRNLLSHGAF